MGRKLDDLDHVNSIALFFFGISQTIVLHELVSTFNFANDITLNSLIMNSDIVLNNNKFIH